MEKSIFKKVAALMMIFTLALSLNVSATESSWETQKKSKSEHSKKEKKSEHRAKREKEVRKSKNHQTFERKYSERECDTDKSVGAPLDGGLLVLLAGGGIAYFTRRKKKIQE